MAIVATAEVITAQLWPQGDIRDPLGVWGAREGVTGDATGGSIKVTLQAPAPRGAAYIYTCYDVNIAILDVAIPGSYNAKMRLLTNWPDIDPLAGVQGYSSGFTFPVNVANNATEPIGTIANEQVMSQNSRFILLFDPRPSAGVLDIVELELNTNTDTARHSFEGYGYYWDRSVLQAPGGPRHPGSA